MQLSIMMKVKSGELTIEDALNQARRDNQEQLKQSLAMEEQQASQYNFSVYKYNRYRWQKRILQIDFNTKMVCSIEKGIVKRQLPFLCVKSCDDRVGAKFSISFRGRHDYELEATSLEDKHMMMQLVNKIIYRNVYSHPVDYSEHQRAPKSLMEGLLFLQRGGLTSFKWVKYEARLHPGQLTLLPISRRAVDADGGTVTSSSLPVVIHFSDGDNSLEKPHSCDTFTLLTHNNEYQFRVPVTDHSKSTEAIQRERDAWVQAIDKLCLDWKRKSQSEHIYEDPSVIDLRIYDNVKDIVEESKSTGREGLRVSDLCLGAADQLSGGGKVLSIPTTSPAKPVPKSRSPVKSPVNVPVPSPVPGSVIVPVPVPGPVSVPITPVIPAPCFIPMPPPLTFNKPNRKPLTGRTRAFHWEEVGSDKIEKSFWTWGNPGEIEIDTSRLYEQFAVQDLGTFGGITEHSNNLHIMLNTKVAHNFNIFLKGSLCCQEN
ncbi:hypothetical protein J4Q44_G00257810 [Coregonus suidteri]|uniref:PH domain-containing protein n=1 Tax=Coregonus suidteri TaxID=861788 RepID=A0AAN8L805_9TELE